MPKRIPGETPPMEGVETKKAKKVPEKKETKLEGLERRVLLVRDFYKAVTAIRADLSVEETAAELDRIFQNIFERSPISTKRKFFQHQKDRQRLVELEKTTVDPFDGKDFDSLSMDELNILNREVEENPLL
jgi:hypothetical protein